MKRMMKSAALVAVGLTFGGAVAAGAVGGDPPFDAGPGTTLCFDNKGSVSRPTGSSCPARTTAFVVANQAQIDETERVLTYYEDRIASLEGTLRIATASLQASIDDLSLRLEAVEAQAVINLNAVPGGPGNHDLEVSARGLRPGTDLFIDFEGGGPERIGVVDENGGFYGLLDAGGDADCASFTNIYVSGTAQSGDTVASETIPNACSGT